MNDMWLPAEERHLLRFCTANDPDFRGQPMTFSLSDLTVVATLTATEKSHSLCSNG